MEMMEAMRINVDGKKIALSDLVEAWKENGKLSEKATTKLHGKKNENKEAVAEYYGDYIVDDDYALTYVPLGIMTFADLKIANEAQEAVSSTRVLTGQLMNLVDRIMYSREVEHSDKAAMVQAVTEEYVALVTEQMDDIGETAADDAAHGQESKDGLVKLTESMGSIVQLGESETVGENIVPLRMNIAIIEPGWGNKEDNHYYPREMLQQHAGVFLGAKMYESDHGDDKTTRTWVSTVDEITGFTETGAPIGRVVVHDRSFAERLTALSEAKLLSRMECSILASGKAKDGKVDGEKAKIVESITEVSSVDWVTRAGAGGRALNLAESEQEAAMPKDKQDIKEKEEKKELEGTKDVIITEKGKDQPGQEPDSDKDTKQEKQEETLNEADVLETLGGTNLPKEIQAWLAESEYKDKGELAKAVEKAVERVKAITGSGNVVGMGETVPASTQPEPPTEESKLADFNRAMAECGFPEV